MARRPKCPFTNKEMRAWWMGTNVFTFEQVIHVKFEPDISPNEAFRKFETLGVLSQRDWKRLGAIPVNDSDVQKRAVKRLKPRTYIELAAEAHHLSRSAEAMSQHLHHAALDFEQRQRGRALQELRRARDEYSGLFIGKLDELIKECEAKP